MIEQKASNLRDSACVDAVSCQHCAGTKDCKEGFVFLHFGSCYCAAANLKEMVDEK